MIVCGFLEVFPVNLIYMELFVVRLWVDKNKFSGMVIEEFSGGFFYSLGDSTIVITARVRLTRTCSDFGSDSLGNDFLYGEFLYNMGDFYII